jgi:hypothetical protein
VFAKDGLGVKYFEIDSSRSIIYADPSSILTTIDYSSPVNIGSSNYIHRTPKSHLYYNDGTYIEIQQNAIIDMLLYHITTDKNGTIIPNRNVTENVFDLTDVVYTEEPFWNIVRDITNTSQIVVNTLDDKLYAGDLTVETEFIVDPTLSFEFNTLAGKTSFDVGVPEVFITEDSNIPDSIKTIDELVSVYDFQHSGSIGATALFDRSSSLFTHYDHTSNVVVDFSSMVISINQINPTKVTKATNVFISNYELFSIRNYAYQNYITTDLTSGSPQLYTNIIGATYIDENL